MGPGARPGALSAYPNLSHQPTASDSESESLTGRLRSLSLPEARGPGSEAAGPGSEWPPESGPGRAAGTRLGMPRARRPGPGTSIISNSESIDSDLAPRRGSRRLGSDP